MPLPRTPGIAVVSLAFITLGALSGCDVVQPIAVATTAAAPSYSMIAAPAVGAISPTFQDGPLLIFDNDSSRTIEVRYWIGRVDVTAPNGVADVRTSRTLVFDAAPGERILRSMHRTPFPTGANDAVVRFEARPRLDDGTLGEATWLEFTRPAPFNVRAKDAQDGALAFERFRSDGTLVDVPVDLRPVDHNGEFPVYAADAARASQHGE